MILFFNFAPFSYGGGAERWMLDVATAESAHEKVCLVSMTKAVSNVYAKLVHQRQFTARMSLPESTSQQLLVQIGWNALIPFTLAWKEIRTLVRESRVIYTKLELNELMILMYFGGLRILKKTTVGFHSPLEYQHDRLTLFEWLHNVLYTSSLMKWLLQKTAHVHVLTANQAHSLHEKNNRLPVITIPNYILNKTHYKQRSVSSILRVVTLGELSWRKGSDILYDVIRQTGNEIHFDIIGDGYLSVPNDIKAKKNVKYHGYLSQSIITLLLKESDVLFMPSRGEGFSLAMLEGISHGLILVTSQQTLPQELAPFSRSTEQNTVVDYKTILQQLIREKESGDLQNRQYEVWLGANATFDRNKTLATLHSSLFK